VTGGNVSFYNESPDGPIYPSPVIGMLGEMDDIGHTTSAGFKNEGDAILLLGKTSGHIGGSEYLKEIHGLVAGDAPPIDLFFEKNLQETILLLIREGLVVSAHDVSEGGVACALAECCLFGSRLGARVELEPGGIRADYYLFGEDQSRIIISVDRRCLESVNNILQDRGLFSKFIGSVGGDELMIKGLIRVGVEEIGEIYEGALKELLGVNGSSA
jgi:phosphoribosylformylglycinamidine synthase